MQIVILGMAVLAKYSCFEKGCLTAGEKLTDATVSKVIMGDGGFTVACVNLLMFQRGGKKQHKHL